MRIFRGNFDLGKDFVYGIFDATDGSIVGGTGLHPRIGPGACEIGYWIRKEAVGRGFATEAAAVVANVQSGRTPSRLRCRRRRNSSRGWRNGVPRPVSASGEPNSKVEASLGAGRRHPAAGPAGR